MYILPPKAPIINWSHPLTKNLVLDVPFYEGGAPGGVSNRIAELVHKRHFIVNNGPLTWKQSAYGPYIVGNGSNQYLGMEFASWQQPVKAITHLLILIKSDWNTDTTNNQNFISTIQTGGYAIELNGTASKISWYVRANGGYQEVNTDETVFTNNVPVVVVSTYDHQLLKIYINGILKNTTDLGSGFDIQYSASGGIAIGCNPDGSSPPLSEGSCIAATTGIKLARMWGERALTASEVKSISANPYQIYKGLWLPSGRTADKLA